jgi:hypothetical protein
MRYFLIIIFCLILTSCKQINTKNETVRFDNIWSSPFHVSREFPNRLVNDEGKYLFILNNTEWAYFACDNPAKVIEKVKKLGANVIRVHLEGTPYFKDLGYDLWPWGGSRKEPDFTTFNEKYWDEVEKRIRLAGENGIGLDMVLYFTMHPEGQKYTGQKAYWDRIINRLSKYSNILTWEIMNEYIANESFQDSVGNYFKANDPWHHPVCSSDGTTEDALWPQKSWMDLAIVHTCTGQDGYDLEKWYLDVARNTAQHGKPAINNETGREKRHKNDDPIHRRKQSWLFNTAGCFWTWHAWDGCEGINDTTYYFDGWQYLKPLRSYFESLPFWKMEPNYTVCTVESNDLVSSALTTPVRDISVMYCCSKESGKEVRSEKAFVRIKDGIYKVKFINPSDLKVIGETEYESKGLRNVNEILLPDFTDDIIVEISVRSEKKKTLIDGTL